ncbi:MAG: DUF2806 domain-containing protein [Chloroflexi bacterium]|nr:DUF2806 domain-containing protein [Chloroflexota bacterium]
MSDNNALINIGEISKPATVLIEKISDAVGGIFRPYQIRRVAEAEAHAEKIKVASQIEITDLQRRALHRFLIEEAKKQDNIETITRKALLGVREDARPREIEDDWITNFFDRCRLVSDDEMQQIWAKILAGEANSPGKFSKRTVNLLASLDKSDAELFSSLCSFVWNVGDTIPLIYDKNAQSTIYKDAGITFDGLRHLDDLGLISYEAVGYMQDGLPQKVTMFYYQEQVNLELPKPENNEISTGYVLYSKSGKDLAIVCNSRPVPGFKEFVIEKWKAYGYKVELPEAKEER